MKLELTKLPAGGLAITPNQRPWRWSSWSEVFSYNDQPLILSAMTYAAGAEADFELEVGTGYAGAEESIVTLKRAGDLPVAILIPAKIRVALRLRQLSADITPWTFWLFFHEQSER